MLFKFVSLGTRSVLIVALLLLPSATVAQQPDNSHTVHGQFSRSKAMRALYGNYSAKSSSSSVKDLSDYAPQFGKVVGTVRVMLDVPYSEKIANYRMLVTYAVPKEDRFNCHPCAPSVSAFLFERRGNDWFLKNTGYDLSVGGSSGQATLLRLIDIGPFRHALIARPSFVAQGDVTEEVTIFVPDGDGFAQVFNINTLSDDSANCQMRKVDCSRDTATIEFIRNPSKEVWDIRVTETELVNAKVVKAAKVTTYEFTSGKYEIKM